MKIAHVGDAHWGLNYPGPAPEARFNDICRVMDWVADKIIDEECELVLVAGDCFKDARVFIDRASQEISAFVSWLRRLAANDIPVIAIPGTPSHDSIAAYKLVQEMQIPGVSIHFEPTVVPYGDAQILCIPGMNRSMIANRDEYKGMSAQEIHQLMTDRITDMVRGLSADMNGECNILLSHITAAGSDKGYEDLLMQQEPVLTNEAIESSNIDLVCLGHIHKMQCMHLSTPTFYCGSPERLSFNEQDVLPGFWVHDTNRLGDSKEIVTPARDYITLEYKPAEMPNDGFSTWLDWIHGDSTNGEFLLDPELEGCIVRVRYKATEEQAKQISPRRISNALYDAGAFYVANIEADVEKSERIRSQDAKADMDPIKGLNIWCDINQVSDRDREDLANIAGDIIQEVGL